MFGGKRPGGGDVDRRLHVEMQTLRERYFFAGIALLVTVTFAACIVPPMS